jgi:hypothetical protein
MTELQNALFEYLDNNTDISMKDFINKIKADFKTHRDSQKKDKKTSKSDVVKPLNAYQLFVKEQMKKFKDDDSKLTGKELMKEISILWKQSKETSIDHQDDNDDQDEVVSSPIVEVKKNSLSKKAK